MGKHIEELAKMLKPNQTNTPGMVLGTIVKLNPLTIAYGDRILLTGNKLILSYTFNEVRYLCLEGDKVIMQPDNTINRWFILDKAVTG